MINNKYNSLLLLLFSFSALFSQTSTTASGNWNNGTLWSNGVPNHNSVAYINHSINLNQGINMGNGSYFFNAPAYTATNNINTWGNGSITFNSRVEVNSISLNNNFSLNVNGCDTVFINGNFNLTGNTDLYVSDCAVIIVNGNLAMHNNVDAIVNGILYVNGTLTATGNAGVDGNGSVQSNGQTFLWGNSDLFGNSTACPGGCSYGSGAGLPIELKSFEASLNENNNKLVEVKWTTLSEINNSYFIIEYSTDGRNFNEVDQVEGAGNSNRELNYSRVIQLENIGSENYFRLKQVDYDGSSKTFNAVSLQKSNSTSKFSNKADAKVYPNPYNGNQLKVSLENFEAGQYDLALINASGQLIINNTVQLGDSSQDSYFDLLNGAQLSKGIYFVRIQYNGELITKKLIVN